MTLTVEKKKEVVKEYQINKKDTGSAAVQIALITERINYLTGHFKAHPKDTNSRNGLLKLVGNRSSLLKYMAKHDHDKYLEVIKKLGIRK